MSEASGHALSVVVVSLGDARALASMLEALRGEARAVPLEIIVPATARVMRLLESLAPAATSDLRVIPMPDDAEDAWQLRARGVREARSPIVATLEDHAIPAPGWAARVLAAHEQPHAAIGGVVEKATPDGSTGWAMYFFDYGRYIPPQVAGRREYLSACNVSYKRAALDRVASTWASTMHETTVHFALLERGDTLWLDPGIIVRQRRALPMPEAMQELRHHGRLYGEDCARRLSAAGRALRLAAIPLVPAVHVARAARHALGSPRLTLGFVRAVPALAAFAVAWAAGEGAGLRRGRRA